MPGNELHYFVSNRIDSGPEKRLAVAVIRQAWEDTFGKRSGAESVKSIDEQKRTQEAIQWILHDRDFAYWCQISDMDVWAVRARFIEELQRHA